MHWYNENDPKAAAWLRELIAQGHLPKGVVDERSIVDVRADELREFVQCHFFAGIGGWAYALRLAGWPEDEPVDTGSCPCQPFSCAGKRRGTRDARHLWPVWAKIIAERRPPVIFGEQVASKAGRLWLSRVSAPMVSQRLHWVAEAESERRIERSSVERGSIPRSESTQEWLRSLHRSAARWVGSPSGKQARDARQPWGRSETLECQSNKLRRIEPGSFPLAHGVPNRMVRLRGYGNAIVPLLAAEFVQAYLETLT